MYKINFLNFLNFSDYNFVCKKTDERESPQEA